MQADGTVLIDTSINEDGLIAGSKEIELAMRRMAKSVSDIGDKARIALQKQVDSFSKLNSQYAQQAKKVDELKKKVADYGKQKIPTQEYLDIQRQIESAQKKLDSLIDRQRKFLEMGGSQDSKAYKSMQYDMEELANTIRYAQGELDDLKESGQAFTFGVNTDAARQDMQRLSVEEARLDNLNNRLETSYQSLKLKIAEYQKKILEASAAQNEADDSGKDLDDTIEDLDKSYDKASKSARKYKNSTKEVDKHSKSSSRGGMGIAQMLGTSILFSFVFQGINSILEGIKEGMNNLAQYSGDTGNILSDSLVEGLGNLESYGNSVNATLSLLMSSLLQLKNAFATAFAPILAIVAPALNYLINMITAVITAVAQLIAVLTGQDTFVRATKVQQNYADSLESTAGAAKEAEGSLAAFDKLNVMQNNSEGGAGAAGGELSPDQMFETVPVDNSLTRAIDAAKEKLLELKRIFDSGFFEGIGDVSVFDSIKSSIQEIGNSLNDIFTDSNVTSAFQKMAETLIYDAGRISGSFASIGLTIADNILGGFEKFLNQNKQRIQNFLISTFDIKSAKSTIIANFSVAIADIFSAFRSDNAKQLTADIISIFANAFMGTTLLADKFGRDLLNIILTPITENADGFKTALENTIAPLQTAIGTLAMSVSQTFDEINNMYDTHLSPMFESFKNGWTEIAGSFLDGYNTYFAPVLDNLSQKFSEVWKSTIQPLLSNFIGLIGDVSDLIKAVWENILQPVINWIAQEILPVVSPVIEGLGTLFLNVFNSIGTIFNTFIDAARAVIQFLTTGFSGDWSTAWENIKKSFSDIFQSLPGIVSGVVQDVLSGIESMINGAIGGINSLIKGANGLVGKIPRLDISIPELPEIHLPRLASGTVIPPRAGEFAAILGDNKRETEVVSPVSTMKQAFKEALREFEGFGGNGDIAGYIYLDGKELGQSTVRFVRQEKKRTGKNPVIV